MAILVVFLILIFFFITVIYYNTHVPPVQMLEPTPAKNEIKRPRTPTREEIKQQKILEENNFILENGITISQEYDFFNFDYDHITFSDDPIHFRFIIDTDSCNVVITSYGGMRKILPFSDILGCEIISNNEVAGGVGRAVVGGLIAGDAGAIVGATTAKEQIMSYKLILYIKEITSPIIELDLIRNQVKKTDPDYKAAVQFARNINATIKAIITYNS